MYVYDLIDECEAKTWLQKGSFRSTIGYEETAHALEMITGVPIPVNREQIKMRPWDEALIFRLTKRIEQTELKGQVGLQFIRDNSEFGILKRIQ